MATRADGARRILAVQQKLYRIEELKYANLKQRLARLEREQIELTQALSGDGALAGLFIDVTARRLVALRTEAARLVPVLEAQAQRMVEHGGRAKNAEKLATALAREERQGEERAALEEIVEAAMSLDHEAAVSSGREAAMSPGHASLKQDR